MKEALSEETLSNYLFELLDEKQRLEVEIKLNECPESRKRLTKMKLKFSQLNLLEPQKAPTVNFPLLSTIACAAALLIAFFLQKPFPNSVVSNQQSAIQRPIKSNTLAPQRFFQLEHFSEKKDDFSLLSKLEAPLKETIDLKIPEVRIQYDDENYEIVDLRNYESLNLPSGILQKRQNNIEHILSLN